MKLATTTGDFWKCSVSSEESIKLIRDAGATPVGAGIVIEKAFQDGGKQLREEGFRVESLARIASMSQADGITFIE